MNILLTLLIYLLILWLGASIGSFLSVVVHRVPAGLSIVHPSSRCPKCGHPLTLNENIPVLGWLWLKGRCSACRTPIPVRYPLLEAGSGIVFVLIFALFGVSWETVGYWTFFSWLLALALIDIDTMTLPNSLTQSGLVAGLGFQALLGLSATASLAGSIQQLMDGVLGAVLGIWLVDAIAIVGTVALGQAAMGGGDAKLSAMMGAWIGWKLLLLAGFLACAMGAFAGGTAIALGLLNRRQPFPFGPFLALGGFIAAIWGNGIITFYLQLFFPTLEYYSRYHR
ncbi:prepilin signal peptidase PulO-like peptidase [Leptolyngbyaceae cyanobacterium JSC-12]|nr:prepilin signal peptidase PulO-like peptidase [Leptolyngbyaceae cyanobacterium JSC-12]